MNRKLFFVTVAFSLLFGTLVFACFQALTVEALVPSIESVSFREVGSTTWVDITVFHQGSPTPIGSDHYVSNIQIEINDIVQDLPQSPQTTGTFTVEYNLGPNTDSYAVRARALCNLHGYSGYSAIITYPTPSPSPTPSSTPTPPPTPTPTSTATPSTGPTPTPTPSSSQSPVPSASPTSSPEPTTTPNGFLPQEALYAIVIAAVIIIIGLLLYFMKRKR